MSKYTRGQWSDSSSTSSSDEDDGRVGGCGGHKIVGVIHGDCNREVGVKKKDPELRDKVTRFRCNNPRCDEDIVCVGVGAVEENQYYCSRACYFVKQSPKYGDAGPTISKQVTIKGRGGTGLLKDSYEELDHLVIQVNQQFGRVVKIDNSKASVVERWRKICGGGDGTEEKVPDTKEEEKQQKLAEKLRLNALLNIGFEDSDSEEEKDTEEDHKEENTEAEEEIHTILSSGVHSNVCPLHPPLVSPYLDRGKIMKAYVINVVTPWHLYLQTVDMIIKTEKINSICNRSEPLDPRLADPNWTPKVGGHCCAKYEDKFYRAKILKDFGNTSFQVKYMDYGNTEIVEKQNVRQLSPEVTLIPRQCIYFKISNAKPRGGGGNNVKWSKEACNFAIEHLDGGAVELEFDAVERQIIHVGKLNVLSSISGAVKGDFGNALVDNGLADRDSYFLT